jgi:hypothetical protein
MRTTVCLIGLTALALWASDRPVVSGTWQLDPSQAGKLKLATLEIRQSADTVAISEEGQGKSKKVDLECGVDGKQCKIKEPNEEISFWYDGASLVMMEMRHNNDVVVKTLLEPSGDGKTLKMEVKHIAPSGQKDESYTLTKQ